VGDLIWPRRAPRENEPLSEYLICQSDLRAGEGLILPTTIFTKTDLMRRIPFTNGLKRYDDMDWLLRACTSDGFGIEFAHWPQPLAVWHVESRRAIYYSQNWDDSLDWAKTHRALLTRRAYASFVLTDTSA